MRLRMERGTKSILQYQLPIETILTRLVHGSSLLKPDGARKTIRVLAYHVSSPSFMLPFQVKHMTMFRREARLRPNVYTRVG